MLARQTPRQPMLWLFWRWGSHELFAQTGFQLWSLFLAESVDYMLISPIVFFFFDEDWGLDSWPEGCYLNHSPSPFSFVWWDFFWDRVSSNYLPKAAKNWNPPVTRNMVLKITWVLTFSRRIEARHKDSVKVTVKFIMKHYTFNRLKADFL
jgi:hypothetical protein